MNIEELSKAQLILLTILVNFVTSVATGIITVSLLDQAPPFVTQTVNRVVEHTIETVAQSAPAAVIAAPAPSNQDLVTGALGADASRIAAIYSLADGTTSPALAVGTFLPNSRTVVTANSDALPKEAIIEFADESYAPASLVRTGGGLALYGLADKAALPKAPSPSLVASGNLKLGETALAISADGSASTGIIARVDDKGIQTTLPGIGAGSAVVDLSGNLIGLAAGGTAGLLVSADEVVTLLSATSTATSTASGS